ncbi:DUF2771 family protein [Jatrophihabitans sp. YIM 134969]
MPPVSRRLVRRAALVAVAGAGAATLVACDKPLPEVTFQSGSRSVLVEPNRYCFELADDTCHDAGAAQRTLRTVAGGVINISVPRTVADNAWIVKASNVGDDGTLTAIEGAGSAAVVDNHHVAVEVPAQSSGSYLLTVSEYRSGSEVPTGTWNLTVSIGA